MMCLSSACKDNTIDRCVRYCRINPVMQKNISVLHKGHIKKLVFLIVCQSCRRPVAVCLLCRLSASLVDWRLRSESENASLSWRHCSRRSSQKHNNSRLTSHGSVCASSQLPVAVSYVVLTIWCFVFAYFIVCNRCLISRVRCWV